MTSSPSIDLENIQGDVIFGLQKRHEDFVFFEIVDTAFFHRKLAGDLLALVTSSKTVADFSEAIAAHKASGQTSLLANVGVNVAFSSSGLRTLGVLDDLGDQNFTGGQLQDSFALQDPGTGNTSSTFNPEWEPAFKQTIHGVFLVASDSEARLATAVSQILGICTKYDASCSINTLFTLRGRVRSGSERGHEHFGFMDGLSQPALVGLGTPNTGVNAIAPGIILVGNDGDASSATRPAWAKDRSFLVFRKLKQLVPEFDEFLEKNPPPEAVDRAQGSALMGARLMGRLLGTPVNLAPLSDDPSIATDLNQVNDFDYSNDVNASGSPAEVRCPFAAHLRKTNPRAGLTRTALDPHRIIRNGIPYGPEVTESEAASHTTTEDRGLAFVCYQSDISQGFAFLQKNWCNNPQFPFLVTPANSGLDPIIGQPVTPSEVSTQRQMFGSDPNAPASALTLPALWVVPKGGEYFFSPSLSAIKGTLGMPSD